MLNTEMVEVLKKAIKEHSQPPILGAVSGSVLANVIMSEQKLKEMAELHKPKVYNGRSDFYLAWRLCYEWMSGNDR